MGISHIFDEKPKVFLFVYVFTILIRVPIYLTCSTPIRLLGSGFLGFFNSRTDLGTCIHSELRIFQAHYHFLLESLQLFHPYLTEIDVRALSL